MRMRSIVIGLAVVALAALAGLLAFQRESSAFLSCDSDLFEGNDSLETAVAVTLPYDQDGLVLCEAESIDYYSFHLFQGDQVQIDSVFDHESGNIDLRLLDADGPTSLAVSDSLTDNEKITYTVENSGTHFLRVDRLGQFCSFLFCDKDGQAYELHISAARPPLPILCADDAFEENDTVATASSISPPFDQGGLVACANDFDAYSFPLATGGDMQIDTLFSDANGNIDLVLFNPSGSVVAVGNSETDNEKISYRAIQQGTYTARVQFTGGVPPDGTPYRLQVTTSCGDDSFEENDTVGDASLVSLPFNLAGLRACPDDEDWFSFPLSVGQQIQVNALFIHAANANINLSLRDPNGALVDFSGSPTDNEKITHTAAKDGTYTVGVSMLPNARAEGNGYWLQISASAAPLECLDDAFEDNDTRETATAVSLPFSQPGLTVCFEPEDEDWFSFPLSTGVAVQIDALFSTDEGNINIRLFRDGTAVAQSISLDDNEKIAFTATEDGTYTVQVDPLPDPFSDPGNTYALEISATCVSDAFEPNDSLETAVPVSLTFSEEDLTVCPEEHDYYSLPLTAGGTVQIDASFSTAEGNISIRLFDPEGGVVAQSISETDDEKIAYTAATTGTHTLQVELLPDLSTAPGNSYGLEISATEPPTPTITSTPTVTPTAPATLAVTATPTATSPVVPPTATTTTAAPTATATTTPGLPGDVDCSGETTSIDAALILQVGAGLIGEDDLACPENGDASGDGAINSIDAALALQCGAGLLDCASLAGRLGKARPA